MRTTAFCASVASSDNSRNPARGCAPPKAAERGKPRFPAKRSSRLLRQFRRGIILEIIAFREVNPPCDILAARIFRKIPAERIAHFQWQPALGRRSRVMGPANGLWTAFRAAAANRKCLSRKGGLLADYAPYRKQIAAPVRLAHAFGAHLRSCAGAVNKDAVARVQPGVQSIDRAWSAKHNNITRARTAAGHRSAGACLFNRPAGHGQAVFPIRPPDKTRAIKTRLRGLAARLIFFAYLAVCRIDNLAGERRREIRFGRSQKSAA